MNPRVKELLEQAKQLPDEDRAEFGHELLASVETELEEPIDEVQKAWAEELQRRLEDMDSGRVRGLSIEEFMDGLRTAEP